MTQPSELDLGPLTWVKSEIDLALGRADESLEQAAGASDAAARVQFAQTHLHQARGALSIVGLDGLTQFATALDQLLGAMARGESTPDAERLALARRALAVIGNYLEELIHGTPDQPLRLLGLYGELAAARGAPAVSPAELFYPDLSLRPPRRRTPPAVAGAERARRLRQYRTQFERGLLQWLREPKDNAGPRQMGTAVVGFDALATTPQLTALWWSAQAFYEALALGDLGGTPEIKRLCSGLHTQIRRVSEGVAAVPDRLMRELLYWVSRAPLRTDLQRAVRATWHLDALLPEAGARVSEMPLAPLLKGLQRLITNTKSEWDDFCGGQAAGLPRFQAQLGELAEQGRLLGRPALDRLLAGVDAFAQWLRKDPLQFTPVIALEVASALLLGEAALDRAVPDTAFSQQVDDTLGRLQALMRGDQLAAPEGSPTVEAARRAQEREALAQVAREILTNLAQVEQTLDDYFRNQQKRAPLANLAKPLKQIAGALVLIGDTKAISLVNEAADTVARFCDAAEAPPQGEFEALAQRLSALGFYVQALQHGRADLDRFLNPGAAATAAEPDDDEAPLELMPAFDLDAVEAPEATAPAGTPEPAAEAAPEQAPVADADAEHGDEHKGLLASVDALHDEHGFEPEPDSAPAALPGPAPETQKLMAASAEELDAELLSIFIEEAHEVLATIGERLELSRSEPAGDHLTAIRRGFHTLKGSGRMVGLRDLGEAAWGIEQTLNRWLQLEWPPSAALHHLIDASHQVFSEWVTQLEAGGGHTRDVSGLMAEAERLRNTDTPIGEPERMRPVAAPAPAEADASPGVVETSLDVDELLLGEDGEVLPVAGDLATPDVAEEISLEEYPPLDEPAPVIMPPADETLEALSLEDGPSAPASEEAAFQAEETALEDWPPSDEFEPLMPPEASFPAEETALEPLAFEEAEPMLEAEALEDLEELEPIEAPEVPEDAAAPSPFEDRESFDEETALEDFEALEAGQGAAPVAEPELLEDFAALDELEPLEAPELAAPANVPDAFEDIEALDEIEPLETPELAAPADVPDTFEDIETLDEIEPLETPDALADFETLDELEPLGAAERSAAPEVPQPPADTEPLPPLAPLDAAEPIEAVELPDDLEPIEFAVHEEDNAAALEEPAPADAPQPSPEPEVEPEPSPEPDHAAADFVHIGEAEISRPLYDLYCGEARHHLATLHTEFGRLAGNPTLVPAESALRAAHTLAGISGTARIMSVHALARALEHAVERLRDNALSPDAEQADLLIATNATLEAMLDDVDARRMPFDMPELIDQLDRVGRRRDLELDLATGEVVAPEAAPEPAAPAEAPPPVHDDLDEQLLPIFLEEGAELVRDLHGALRSWHGDHAGEDHPKACARLLHTLKGSARMAGAMVLGQHVHQLESRLEAGRAAGHDAGGLIDELVSGLDVAEHMIQVLAGVDEPSAAVEPAPGEPAAAAAAPTSAVAIEAAPAEAEASTGGATLRVRADAIDRFVNEAGEIGIARARIEGELRTLRRSLLDLTENVIRLRNQLREVEIQADVQMQSRLAQAESHHTEFDPLEMDRYTRLQELTRMMAESVGDVTTVQQSLLRNLDGADLALHSQARLSRDLQQALMQVRMVPFDSLADRLYRVVRQTAKELGKRANLDLRGGRIEIDRSVLEHMTAPLEHLLRNAIAHGIEPAAARAAAGKDEIGQITLSVSQEGNEIAISLADDGAGLDYARIAERARANGLLGPDEEADERRLTNLIFIPGFSTAGNLSSVSGRGVGMDVVKSETAAVGGRIDIQASPGGGTEFRIYLPLTLAVTQAVLVRAGNRSYAVPSRMIAQVMELKADAMEKLREAGGTEWMGEHFAYRYLPHLLGDRNAQPELQRFNWVLLLRAGAQTLALHVDGLRGNQEIVVKNAGPQLVRIVGISGATVLGDGEIVLIVNPVALASRSLASNAADAPPVVLPTAAAEVRQPTIMVVDDSLTVRKITSRLLEREGFRVVTAKDGVDALEALLEALPDVILSDIEMPRMDGFDLLRNIRADDRTRAIPVIMITSRLADKHRDYAAKIGADHYLGKPYDEAELLGLLRGYVAGLVPA